MERYTNEFSRALQLLSASYAFVPFENMENQSTIRIPRGPSWRNFYFFFFSIFQQSLLHVGKNLSDFFKKKLEKLSIGRCLKIRGGIQGLFEFWLIFLFQFSGNKIVTLESKSIIDIPDNDAIGSKKFSMERSEEISNKRIRKYHLSNFSFFVREERYFHRFFRIRIFDCIISNT